MFGSCRLVGLGVCSKRHVRVGMLFLEEVRVEDLGGTTAAPLLSSIVHQPDTHTHFELGFSVNASITLGRKARNRRAQRSVKTVWFNFVCSGTRKDDRTLSAAASQL